MKNYLYILLSVVSLSLLTSLTSCEREDIIVDSESFQVTEPSFSDLEGFYLLNEGNMGENKSSLDYFDALTGIYHRNIYAERNPNVIKDLGDVGNDLLIYRGILYAVINCSHKVEVMNADDAVRITKIDIPNCRYAVGFGDYVYVSSYVGPVQIDPKAVKGAVFKVDTRTMKVVGSVEVGYQPEEMVILGNKLFVANSGGYRVPNYDNTISIIDLDSFEVVDVIVLDNALNFHRLEKDRDSRLWLASRGDYYGKRSNLYVVDPKGKKIVKTFEMPVSDMCVDDNKLYAICSGFSFIEGEESPSFVIIDMETMEVIEHNFIKDGTDHYFQRPYGIAVDPISKDIYICDAKMYVVSGNLYCFSKDGILKWKQKTGQIPSSIAFKGKIKEEI